MLNVVLKMMLKSFVKNVVAIRLTYLVHDSRKSSNLIGSHLESGKTIIYNSSTISLILETEKKYYFFIAFI